MKKTAKDEKYIGWKMIGYFLLGAFTFRFQEWVLPVGIVVFLFYFLPRLHRNKQGKMWAASLGIVSFLSSIVITSSIKAYYEHDLHVKTSTMNAYEMNFSREYEKIKSAIDAEGDLAINNLELSFKKNGEIKQLSYEAFYVRDGKNMIAWIYLNHGSYEIVPSISEQQPYEIQNGINYISSPNIYFQALDLHGLKKMIADGDSYHVSFSNTDNIYQNQEHTSLWDIQKSGITQHVIETATEEDGEEGEDSEASVPYHISITSMKGTESGYYGDHYDYYTISPDLYE
jgi:hypothetical protein